MERRGFIGKFAKVIAGAALSAETLAKEEEHRRFPGSLPKVIKVSDETVNKADRFNLDTIRLMMKRGLDGIYPVNGPKNSLRALFPNVVSGGKIGIKTFSFTEDTHTQDVILDLLTKVLMEVGNGEGIISRENIFRWDEIQATESEEEAETIEVEGYELTAPPALRKAGDYHLMLVITRGEIAGLRPFQTGFLSCYNCKDNPDFPQGLDWREAGKIFEQVCYPDGMKFRLYILDRLADESALYFSSEGVLIDSLFPEDEVRRDALPVKLVEIINLSAPVVPGVGFRRRGDDIQLKWDDEDYTGRYQIYRSEVEGAPPTRLNLIGWTGKREYTDFGGAKREKRFYTVTREWG